MVDVADSFHTGESDADSVYKKFNRSIIGVKGRDGHLQPVKVVHFFCYNFEGHRDGRRIVSTKPGKCPECGQEMQDGKSVVPL